jgi:hypothetical protein
MLYNIPYYPIPTGYKNSTGFLNFNINELTNFDFISINNNEIYYHDNPSEFPAPVYFDTTGTLIESINNNIDTYGVNLSLNNINNNIIIKSLLSGEDGNTIILRSSNTGVTFNDTSLKGGQNFYSILRRPKYPTDIKNINLRSPIFSGKSINKFYVTGFYYSSGTTGYLKGDINSFIGVRNFENIWAISTGLVNRRDLNTLTFSNNKYYFNDILNTNRVPINVKVDYNNILSARNNIDIAEIVIKDLNAPTASRLSGIIFRITGVR